MMMKRAIYLFLCILGPAMLCGQSFNMILEGSFDDSGVVEYNDVWGYNAPNGTEVAILGGYQEIFFLDVSNPANITVIEEFEVYNLDGAQGVNSSIWRDFKTYGNYAYASADQGSAGLLIFDLSYVPDSVPLVDQRNDFFNRSHNIYIDTQHGRLYTAGANTHPGGTIILDLASDPEDPTELGSPSLALGYIHDIHVADHIGYCSHGNDGTLTIYDFSDPTDTDPMPLKDLFDYPETGYNHSAWIDASGTRLVFCDETHGQSVKLVNPQIDNIQTTNYHLFKSQLLPGNSNSIAHNPFIKDNLVYLAYYHDGVQVFDISDSNNIVNVGYYDTYTNSDYSGYQGCWGVYPFLESGRILASDITNGLYVTSLTGGILPVNFLSFQARKQQRDVALSWRTSVPDDGDRFLVEHSKDGGVFRTIADADADRERLVYGILHDDPGPGTHYYRIRSLLTDGSEKLTDVRVVTFLPPEGVLIEAYPTITQGPLTVNVFHSGQARVLSLDGRVLEHWDLNGPAQLQADLSIVPSGNYLVEFVGDSGLREVIAVQKY